MASVHLSVDILAILFFVGGISGFIDSIAGGGGLVALPALLFIGLPPQAALGTNKLQGSFGTLMAAWNFIRKRQVNLRDCLTGIISTLIGASCGALLVQTLDPSFIEPLIPFLLLLVFVYTLFSRKLGVGEQKALMGKIGYFVIFGFLFGFYDGFFGPGTGSFWTFTLMLLLGANIIKATGITKVMNFTSNIVALLWFITGGNVIYSIGFVMAAGQLIGARIGSSLAIKNGARFIRPLYLTVVFLTIVRLLWNTFQHS